MMTKKVSVNLFFNLILILAAFFCILFVSCGGGFNKDGPDADDLGSAIFGPDSLNR